MFFAGTPLQNSFEDLTSYLTFLNGNDSNPGFDVDGAVAVFNELRLKTNKEDVSRPFHWLLRRRVHKYLPLLAASRLNFLFLCVFLLYYFCRKIYEYRHHMVF